MLSGVLAGNRTRAFGVAALVGIDGKKRSVCWRQRLTKPLHDFQFQRMERLTVMVWTTEEEFEKS
jgi:hypothetical protein